MEAEFKIDVVDVYSDSDWAALFSKLVGLRASIVELDLDGTDIGDKGLAVLGTSLCADISSVVFRTVATSYLIASAAAVVFGA